MADDTPKRKGRGWLYAGGALLGSLVGYAVGEAANPGSGGGLLKFGLLLGLVAVHIWLGRKPKGDAE